MKFTKNKLYLTLGIVMVPLGLFLTIRALLAQGHPPGTFPWVRLGPFGLMSIVGGIGLLFLPDKVKFK